MLIFNISIWYSIHQCGPHPRWMIHPVLSANWSSWTAVRYEFYGFLIRDLTWFGTWNEFRYENHRYGTAYGFWFEILIGTELGTEFQWEKINKKCRFSSDFFFEIAMEPFIFPIFAPYQVPYRKKSGLKIRTTYLTRKFRTKIRTGTDFRWGSVVQAGPVMPNWPFNRSD